MSTQTCAGCGSPNPVESRFCARCGAALHAAAAEEQAPSKHASPLSHNTTGGIARFGWKGVVAGVALVAVLAFGSFRILSPANGGPDSRGIAIHVCTARHWDSTLFASHCFADDTTVSVAQDLTQGSQAEPDVDISAKGFLGTHALVVSLAHHRSDGAWDSTQVYSDTVSQRLDGAGWGWQRGLLEALPTQWGGCAGELIFCDVKGSAIPTGQYRITATVDGSSLPTYTFSVSK